MFISYAQNFEDVMLNRVFSGQKPGFYIDIGAHHPVLDSVTKAFYERGWRGINIEPVKEYFDLLQQDRERDINLNIAVGETESELEFFELEAAGLSTFDRETAYRIAEADNYTVNSYKVPLRKLADICREKVNCQIDFLKIDVEGWEEKVILGHDWENFRPVVVVLEATIPNSPIRTETNIKTILEQHNYTHVYFDGLNDYYLANEKEYLAHCFSTPPNVFDKFVRYPVVNLQNQANNLQQIIQEKETEINSLTETLKSKETDIRESNRQNHILQNRLKDEQFEIQRLSKIVSQLQQNNQELRENHRQNHILQNRLKDEQFEIQRLSKIVSQLQQNNQELGDRYQNQIADLQSQLFQAEQTIAAMKTSKFWKMRQVWFRLKTGKSDEE
ncbi:MAG: FkbM family methyltransferase [Xenococcaceae cyanobacterium MO_207.B15]|nr:FkbM family methyltransferase [Xenococcaceae cyanobacterium MO_207.B15]